MEPLPPSERRLRRALIGASMLCAAHPDDVDIGRRERPLRLI